MATSYRALPGAEAPTFSGNEKREETKMLVNRKEYVEYSLEGMRENEMRVVKLALSRLANGGRSPMMLEDADPLTARALLVELGDEGEEVRNPGLWAVK